MENKLQGCELVAPIVHFYILTQAWNTVARFVTMAAGVISRLERLLYFKLKLLHEYQQKIELF